MSTESRRVRSQFTQEEWNEIMAKAGIPGPVVETAAQKYHAVLEQCPDESAVGIAVTMPSGDVYALCEQNGGYSTLYDQAGEEVFEITPDGEITNGYTAGLICMFDQVICDPNVLVPWMTRDEDGTVILLN